LFCSVSHAVDQNVVVVFDDSGSMNEVMRSNSDTTRISAAKNALTSVLETLPDAATVGVRALNSRPEANHWIIPLGPIDRSAIQQQIRLISADGMTPLGGAMADATNALLELRKKQIVGTYQLLVVTDGEATDEELLGEVLPMLKSRGITANVIGVDMRQDHSLATEVNSYRRADDAAALQKAIQEVFAESTSDATDTGNSDYEMLSGLPDDVAAAALTSLTQINNDPLDAAMTPSSSTGDAAATPNPASPVSAAPALGLGGLCCVGFWGILLVSVYMLMKSGRRR